MDEEPHAVDSFEKSKRKGEKENFRILMKKLLML